MPRHTQTHYRRWLLAQPPTRVVGRRHNCYACPLATYFNETRGEEDCWVGETTWVDSHDVRRPLPSWAQIQVARIDRSGLHPITAKDALALVDIQER